MQDAEIKKMHQTKMNKYDERDLGAQIGACLNKAVDIVIAEGKFERQEIEKWVDILFEIGTAKKVAEMLEKIPQEEIINEEEPDF